MDIDELVAGLRACGVDGADEELTALAQSFDADGSGTLEMDELQAAVESLMSARKASDQAYHDLKAKMAAATRAAEHKQLIAEEFKVKAKASSKKPKPSKAAAGQTDPPSRSASPTTTRPHS